MNADPGGELTVGLAIEVRREPEAGALASAHPAYPARWKKQSIITVSQRPGAHHDRVAGHAGRWMRAYCLVLVAVALLGVARGWAEPAGSSGDQPVSVRVADYPGFGRIVFEFAAPVWWHITRDGALVTLQFDPANTIAAAPSLPRNVTAMSEDGGVVEITVAPGARLRPIRLGNVLELDVLDPLPKRPPPAALARTPAMAKLVRPDLPIDRHEVKPIEPLLAPSPPGLPKQKPTTPATPAVPPAMPAEGRTQPAVASALQQAPEVGSPPVALAATRAAPTPPAVTSAILLPFGRTVGAAAFRRGGQAVLVFDEARPLDLAALRDDAVFGGAVVHELPAATVILLPLPSGTGLALQHEQEGWQVAAGPVPSSPPLAPVERDGALFFPLKEPGRTVSFIDPLSGATVLVGTELGPNQGVSTRLRAPQFVVWPTWQGIAVEPLSDRLTLQAVPAGFAMTLVGGSLAMTAASAETAALTNAVGLTRRFGLPAEPVTALATRLREQVAEAAATPPLSRGEKLVAAGKTMIALGWGAEAQAELRLAAQAAPQEVNEPDQAALAAIAALLAWRPEQAGAIEDPRLSGSDEVTLWRAVRDAELRTAIPKAAEEFAATWPLILTYRSGLRERLLPLAAETMIAGGAATQAQALLAEDPNDPRLTLARGMLAQSDGQSEAALAIYDALSAGPDRLVRVRAARRAVELRLASGKINAAQAADEMAKLIAAWQGDERELSLRERLAELRAEAGLWRSSLALLRTTAHDFPDRATDIRARMQRIFAAAVSDGRFDALPPLEFVALVDENTDVLPAGAEGDALSMRLADRLLALDLPEQAEPLLQKLERVALPGAGRAELGARLAALRLRQGNAAGALAALSDSSAEGLAAGLTEKRTLLLAEAEARNGDVAGAVAALTGLGTPAADEKRATILEQAQDWLGAEGALKDYVAKTIPSSGTLDDGQRRTLVRLAAAVARAGDEAMLATLRTEDESRMGTGPLADMFRLLTADAVHGVADLRRSGQEAVLAHALPEDLKAVR